MSFPTAALTCVQVSPRSVDRNIPPSGNVYLPPPKDSKTPPPRSPAKMVPSCRKRGDMARVRTESFVSPRLAARQVYPPSVERKTPPPEGPGEHGTVGFVCRRERHDLDVEVGQPLAGALPGLSPVRGAKDALAGCTREDGQVVLEVRGDGQGRHERCGRGLVPAIAAVQRPQDAARDPCEHVPIGVGRAPGVPATVHAKPPGGPMASGRPCASSRGDGQISTTTASARNMAAVFSAAARLMGCASQAAGSGTGHPNPRRTPLSSSISSALTGSDGGREGPKSRPMAAMSAFLVRACPPERASSLP